MYSPTSYSLGEPKVILRYWESQGNKVSYDLNISIGQFPHGQNILGIPHVSTHFHQIYQIFNGELRPLLFDLFCRSQFLGSSPRSESHFDMKSVSQLEQFLSEAGVIG